MKLCLNSRLVSLFTGAVIAILGQKATAVTVQSYVNPNPVPVNFRTYQYEEVTLEGANSYWTNSTFYFNYVGHYGFYQDKNTPVGEETTGGSDVAIVIPSHTGYWDAYTIARGHDSSNIPFYASSNHVTVYVC